MEEKKKMDDFDMLINRKNQGQKHHSSRIDHITKDHVLIENAILKLDISIDNLVCRFSDTLGHLAEKNKISEGGILLSSKFLIEIRQLMHKLWEDITTEEYKTQRRRDEMTKKDKLEMINVFLAQAVDMLYAAPTYSGGNPLVDARAKIDEAQKLIIELLYSKRGEL